MMLWPIQTLAFLYIKRFIPLPKSCSGETRLCSVSDSSSEVIKAINIFYLKFKLCWSPVSRVCCLLSANTQTERERGIKVSADGLCTACLALVMHRPKEKLQFISVQPIKRLKLPKLAFLQSDRTLLSFQLIQKSQGGPAASLSSHRNFS